MSVDTELANGTTNGKRSVGVLFTISLHDRFGIVEDSGAVLESDYLCG
jgi:hypothetical protein